MSIKLEDFIKEHRREFDTDVPSAKLWEKIEGQLTKKKQKGIINIRLWMSIAAAIIVLLSVTLIYVLPGREKEMNTAGINRYEKKQLRFAGLIEEKRDSLQIFAKANPELYNKFNADLENLEQAYDKLKKELPGSPNRQLVVKAMMKNLEIQLQVVSQQLSIINEVDQYKKENSI